MIELQNQAQADHVLKQDLSIIFKHSTACPISDSAHHEMEKYLHVHPRTPVYLVNVIANRKVSQHIAQKTGVKHESPQVLVLQYGKPVWHASHDITWNDVERGVQQAGGPADSII